MQQSARNLGPSPMPAIQCAHLFTGPVRHGEPFQRSLDPCMGHLATDALQCSEIQQVLPDGQVQIQRGLLKHDPHPCQGLTRCAVQIRACDHDLRRWPVDQPGKP